MHLEKKESKSKPYEDGFRNYRCFKDDPFAEFEIGFTLNTCSSVLGQVTRLTGDQIKMKLW